jgi:hypoxanthine phosphoribosyltransferase
MGEKDMEVYINKKSIQKRVKDLSMSIRYDYCTKDALFVCVLKGSIHFTSDLLRKINLNTPIEFIRVESYVGMKQMDHLRVISFLSRNDIEGKDILIIEDIVDSGRTLNEIIFYFASLNAKSIEICTLLDKPLARKVKTIIPKYIGFSIENKFVVGYGLDYNEKFRNLDDIMICEE